MSERPVVFSASSVNAYLDCHLRWFFSYVLNEEGEQSEPQRVGIAVHDFAEQRLKVMAGTATMADYEDDSISPLVQVFCRDILPTYRDPIAIEEPFQIEVNGIGFSGVIDAIDRHDYPPLVGLLVNGLDNDHVNILRDLKTTGSRPKAGKYGINMIGYYLGATEGLDIPIHAMQLDYIVRTQKPYYWPEVVPIPAEHEVAYFAGILEGVAEGVAREDYAATGLGTYVCGYCPHRSYCGPYQRYQEAP